MRRLLKRYDERFSNVFPREWLVEYRLVSAFLLKTKDDLAILLGGPGAKSKVASPLDVDASNLEVDDAFTNNTPEGENVVVLGKSLQRCLLFEKEMVGKFDREYGGIGTAGTRRAATAATTTTTENNKAAGGGAGANNKNEPKLRQLGEGKGQGAGGSSSSSAAKKKSEEQQQEQNLEFDDEGNAVDAKSAKGIKLRYERKKSLQNAGYNVSGASGGTGGGNGGGAASGYDYKVCGPEDGEPLPPLACLLSSVFEYFFGPWIKTERQNLVDQVASAAGDRTIDSRAGAAFYKSSNDLLVAIRNSLQRTSAVNNALSLLCVYKEYRRALQNYANMLTTRMPPPLKERDTSGLGGFGSSSSSAAPVDPRKAAYKIPAGEEATVCNVIATSEYTAETISDLEDAVKQKLLPQYRDKIDMSVEVDKFRDVTAIGIRILVTGLENRLDAAYREVGAVQWSTIPSVEDESPYVRMMNNVIRPYAESLGMLLPAIYYKNFCDKFAANFATQFYSVLCKQKRFSEMGTHQMLLDLTNVKGLIGTLPTFGDKGEGTVSSMYTKNVARDFGKIELMLKLVGTPTEVLVEVFKSSWPDGTAKDLHTVCSLKGLARKEQFPILEALGFSTSVLGSDLTMGFGSTGDSKDAASAALGATVGGMSSVANSMVNAARVAKNFTNKQLDGEKEEAPQTEKKPGGIFAAQDAPKKKDTSSSLGGMGGMFRK